MSAQDKLSFYLHHRHQIEQWVELRAQAQQGLDDALIAAATALGQDTQIPVELKFATTRTVNLHLPGEHAQSWIELNWTRKDLLAHTSDAAWPALIIASQPALKTQRAAVKDATAHLRDRHGLHRAQPSSQWWVHWRRLTPPAEPIDIDLYARHCITALTDLWHDAHEPMRAALHDLDGAPAREHP